MRYMMLLSGTNPATPPPPELFEAIMKLGGEATQAGVMLDTTRLFPSVSGARVSLTDGKVTVTDGPFTKSQGTHQLRAVRGRGRRRRPSSRPRASSSCTVTTGRAGPGSTDILQVMGAAGP